MESEIIHHLDYNHINYAEKNYMQSYLKNKPSDVIMYSEDGTVFKTHKELLFQTEFLSNVGSIFNPAAFSGPYLVMKSTNTVSPFFWELT